MDTGFLALVAMTAVLCNANEFHHAIFGPEYFVIMDQERELAHSYNKTGFAAGVNAGYEYLEPNNFYFGAEGKYLLGSMKVSDFWWSERTRTYAPREFGTVYKSLEGRVGYNFLAFRDLLVTPYFGVGDKYCRAVTSDHEYKMRMTRETLYVVHGIRVEYVLAESVHFGISFKEFVTMRGTSKSNVSPSYINPLHGGHEISFPWAFRFHGTAESFVVKLEPYFRKDNLNSMELTAGCTLQISCDF